MTPYATSLRVLTPNEIRRPENISKPELPLVSPTQGRLQLGPTPGIKENQMGGGGGLREEV